MYAKAGYVEKPFALHDFLLNAVWRLNEYASRKAERNVQKTVHQHSAVFFNVEAFAFRAVEKLVALDSETRGVRVTARDIEGIVGNIADFEGDDRA